MAKPKIVSILPAEIEEFGELDRRYQEAKPWLDRREDLKAKFREQTDPAPAELPYLVESPNFTLQLSAKGQKREITDKKRAFEALKKTLGITKLIQAVGITFKVLDQHLSEEQQKPFVSRKYTAAREVTVVAKATAKAA